MFCADCGAEVPTTVHGSCPACFVRRTPLMTVPDAVDVEICVHCGARHVGAHWVDPAEGAPEAWVREDGVRETVKVHAEVAQPLLQIDETPRDASHFDLRVQLVGDVEGVSVQDERTVLVRQQRAVCDRCSRMQGDYYAAIVQLRATDRDVLAEELARAHTTVATELERVRSDGNRMAFLSKEGAIHGGWDYYIGDIDAGRQVSRLLKDRLGASVQETAKLIGRREGDDVYRVTFLVRIRLFSAGDFALSTDGSVVQVHGVHHGRAAVTELQHHRGMRFPEGELRRLGGLEMVREAVLVSQDAKDLQVLDPVSQQTVDLLRPEGYEAAGDTVDVARHEGRLYLVPSGRKGSRGLLGARARPFRTTLK